MGVQVRRRTSFSVMHLCLTYSINLIDSKDYKPTSSRNPRCFYICVIILLSSPSKTDSSKTTISKTTVNHLRLRPRIQDRLNKDVRTSRIEINHFDTEDIKKRQLSNMQLRYGLFVLDFSIFL